MAKTWKYTTVFIDKPDFSLFYSAVMEGYVFFEFAEEVKTEIFLELEWRVRESDDLLFQYAKLLRVRMDEEGCYKIMEDLAKRGYAPACDQLAKRYYSGQGVDVDYDQAMEWASKALEGGYLPAHRFFYYYHYGAMGGKRDTDKALSHLQAYCDCGAADGQYKMGLYLCQDKVAQYEKAFHLFEKAAAQGDPNATYWLGRCYLFGRGVESDFNQGRYYICKAYRMGCAKASDDYPLLLRRQEIQEVLDHWYEVDDGLL